MNTEIQDMRPPWHEEIGPRGFYDFRQHIVVLPNVLPRPSMIVDHEMTHVQVCNSSTLGLLQHLAEYLVLAGQSIDDPGASDAGTKLAAILAQYTVDVHEAVAWFGTELNTADVEALRAPDQYRPGVSMLLRTFMALSTRTPNDEEFDFSSIMRIADAIASYALSPPVVTAYLAAGAKVTPERLAADLRQTSNNPSKRFRRLCDNVANAPFASALAWAKWINAGDETIGPLPTLPGPQRKWWQLSGHSALQFSERPPKESPLIPPILRSYFRSDPGVDIVASDWHQFALEHTFLPGLDRYSQTCLIRRPMLRRPLELSSRNAIEAFLKLAWVSVSRVQPSIFEGQHQLLPNGDVLIGHGPDHPTYLASIRMQPVNAWSFLNTFAGYGGGIVASSSSYDYGNGDFADLHLLRGLPHAVMAISDVRSLWMRICLLSDNGLSGDKCIEWRIKPSAEWPEDFGYLLLKPRSRPYPVVVNPIILHNVSRALSVFDVLEAAPGTELRQAARPYEFWVGGCERAVASAMEFFGRGLKQPEEVLALAKRMSEEKKPPPSQNARERLHLVSARR